MDHYLELRRPIGLTIPSRIPLSGKINPLIIGRGIRAHVFVYVGEHPSFVSSEHAKLELINGQWTVADLDSINGTFVNSIKIERGQKQILSSGDRVYFGNPRHNFFLEYEFVVAARRASGVPSKETYALDKFSAKLPSGEEHTSPYTGDIGRSVPFVSSKSMPHLPVWEEVAKEGDIWSCRIFPFLNMQELCFASFTCSQWLQRAQTCLDLVQTIRWLYIWPADGLMKILDRKATVNHARQVSTIIAEGCYNFRDEHVDRIAQLCGNHLQHIELSGIPSITATGMLAIARYCPNTRVLIVRGCRRVGAEVGGSNWDWLTALAQNGSLEYCDLYCAGSSDEAVRNLARLSPRLKRLDLGVIFTEGVTDEGLKEVAEHCPELAHLNLRGCKRVSNDGVTSIAMACGSKLKVLVLHSCEVGNDTLRSIGTHCSSIETLDIHRCSAMTDEGIRMLIQGPAEVYKALKHLDLSNLVITDVALRYLAKSGIQLTTLDLRSCKMITGAGLIELIKVIRTSLKKLDLNGCIRVTPDDVDQIAVLCRGILGVGDWIKRG